jgi:outer membrane protein assembly factor BamB
MAQIPSPRAALAALSIAVLVTGAIAARIGSESCQRGRSRCGAGRVIRWSRPLPGSWIAQNGPYGTTPLQGQAYAAAGGGVAVIGFGATVLAYDIATGLPRWSETLRGVPAGSAIVSVRAWRSVLTVGVAAVGVAGAGAAASRQEIVLDATTGRRLRSYLAARTGGAAWASRRRTVIVGLAAVASYANENGRAIWRVPTGPAEQAWRVAGRKLYVTVSARGEIGTAPVTAVREIDLRTGEERLIQRPDGVFDGTLAGVIDGVLLFSGSSGLSSYSVATGHLIAQRPGAVLEGIDPVHDVLYADIAGAMTGIDPVTLQNEVADQGASMPSGFYSVRAGVAIGLKPGPGGAAWAYSIAKRRAIWTAMPLPWPHFFADSSGLGGSVDQATGTALLVTCAATGQRAQRTVLGDGRACLRPRLVEIGPRGSAS